MRTGWINTKLKDVCELVNGRAYKKDELLAKGKYRVLRVGNFFTNDHWYFSDLELEVKKYCDKGDLLYAWSASFGPRVWSGEKVIFHYHIWKVLPNSSLIDQKFLFYFLMWDVDKIKEDQGAGTTMLHVSKGSMDERDISIPSIHEQQRIVAMLYQSFEGIAKARANAEQNLQNARALFESHLQSVFTKSGERWNKNELGGISKINYGYTESANYEKVGPNFLRITDIQDTGVNWNSVPYCTISGIDLPRYLLKTGDIVFARTGATTGKSYLVNNPPEAVFASYLIRVQLKLNLLLPEFLFLFFQTKTYWDEVNKGLSGSAQGGFNATKLGSLVISYPISIEEQKAIISELAEIKKETQRLEALYQRKITLLDELKKSLLQQAFAGEL